MYKYPEYIDTATIEKYGEVSGFFWYSVSSINKTDRHDITTKLLKVALSTTIITRMVVGFISSHVYH
jgi:hypothetical protein